MNFDPEIQNVTGDPTQDEGARAPRDHKRTTVRFTDSEYERITQEAELSGRSIPDLLRGSHFRHRKLKLLLDPATRHEVCVQVRRIGNNVNQLARRVNSGALEGWYEEFAQAVRLISEMHQLLVGAYGSR